MKKILKILILVIALVVIFVVYKDYKKDPRIEFTEYIEKQKVEQSMNLFNDAMVEDKPVLIVEKMMGDLEDVSSGNASGKVVAGYEDGEYKLSATFENLPLLKEGYFYEGWIVKQGSDLSILSTGKTTYEENVFTADIDLTDHDFYVLTLEPDDNDPAPAEHILEGRLGY